MQNAERRHFRYTQIFSNWYICKTPGTMWHKKSYFYKDNTLSNWDRAQLGLCFTKQSSCRIGCAICDFWPILLLPHVFLWNAYFYSVKHVWAPNRLLGGPRTGPFFWKSVVPTSGRPAYIHIYIYIYMLWGY